MKIRNNFDKDKITEVFNRAQDRLVLQAADLSLETLASMVESLAIDTSPEFQRRERWDSAQQSSLIESFLLNVPIPPVYLSEDDFGTYSVIDGKQRLTTIHKFMRDKLKLTELEAFRSLEGAKFSDLPTPLKNALRVRPYLRVVTLLKQSDPKLKYEVFTRLNCGGEPLNPQEIRNVVFRGKLNDLLVELSKRDFLKSQLKIKGVSSPAYRNMLDVEYVLRFLALRETWEFFSGSLRRSMDAFMQARKDASLQELTACKKLFIDALKACEAIWGTNAFLRPASGVWRDQMLAGMYDAQMIAVSMLSSSEIVSLVMKRKDVINETKSLFEDKDFEVSVRQGTNTPARIVYRISRLHQMLKSLV